MAHGRLGIVVGLLLGLASGDGWARQSLDPQLEQIGREFFPTATGFGDFEGTPPAVPVFGGEALLGYLFLTDDVLRIPAYSGKPVSILVGLDTNAELRGIRIVHHEEPILLVGVTESDLAGYVAQYVDKSAFDRIKIGGEERTGFERIDGISGATITVMVINASITRAARTVAESRAIPLASPADAAPTDPEPTAQTPPAPIWETTWRQHRVRIMVLAAGLLILTTILVLQDWLTRHPTLLSYLRTAFLVYTLLFIGWFALAQLSVVNVLTFVNAVFGGFSWETFLIDPLMFILWGFVAVTLVLWGRGVYCGWLCPFGALQELVNKVAQRLGVPQLLVPALIHERMLAIKYVLVIALFGVSLQSMVDAVRLAEVEPFKTAITLRFQREWSFVLYAAALVVISAVNGKFFCKYVCPLGAALTFPSHFRIFDWLRRRRECGRPCQTCAKECPSQAIRPTGEINANECHHCLDCQVTFWNAYKCHPLVERRKRFERKGQEVELSL